MKQNEGGRRVLIPIGQPLAAMIDGLPHSDGAILRNSRGVPWTSDGFRASFAKAFKRSGIIDDLHFHDLTSIAVTRMAVADCTVPQIAAVTGHATARVFEILLTR